jgi:hypothetical protein
MNKDGGDTGLKARRVTIAASSLIHLAREEQARASLPRRSNRPPVRAC